MRVSLAHHSRDFGLVLFEYLGLFFVPLVLLKALLFVLLPFIAAFVEHSILIKFQIGYESNGDPLFVARGRVEKDSYDDNVSWSVGKMNPRYGLAYLPYGGKVLVEIQPSSRAKQNSY